MEKLHYITEHIDFDWNLNFNKKTIDGFVIISLKNLCKGSSSLKLNSKFLNITKVTVQNKEVDYTLDPVSKVEALGSILTIPIEFSEEKLSVKIEYSTTNKCTALQWMDASTTKGKKHPYLFSQCQAIHARSLYPCQDEPRVKFSYSAKVKAPSNLEVLMSAVKGEKCKLNENETIHHFVQKIPIPSYLVAIVCGNIKGLKVGPRSTVWSEPEMVDEAAEEFSDTEKFLEIAESLCGPYVWGVYDILVLPPSFPFGGMENPCLTFVTPTLLVGDKSLVFVIAHEISHSWTGNLVTNESWEDFWLNEGHTRYVERLIMEKHYKSENMRHFLIESGIACLQESLNTYGKDHPFNQMVPSLVDCDPDDAFSRVPYEKGSNLLFYLENLCGKAQMLRWLKNYLDKFKYQSLSTKQWKDFFFQYMIESENISKSVLTGVDWDAWFYGRWTIPVDHKLNRKLALTSEKLADKWIELDQTNPDIEKKLLEKYNSFLPDQKCYFLQVLNDFKEAVFNKEKLEKIQNLYGYNTSTNSEILYGWALLCIRSNYTCVFEKVFEFLNSQGRLKYTKPIYSALFKLPHMQEKTVANFLKQKPFMHPITANEIKKILKIKD